MDEQAAGSNQKIPGDELAEVPEGVPPALVAFLLVVLGLAGAGAVAIGITSGLHKERTRIVRGTCDDYACFAKVMKRHGKAIHRGALSELPRDARHIHYSFAAHDGEFDFSFPYEKSQFFAWISRLGWSREQAEANHHGGEVLRHDKSGQGFTAIAVPMGYSLSGRPESHTPRRKIVFDETTNIVYLEFFTPIDEKDSAPAPGLASVPGTKLGADSSNLGLRRCESQGPGQETERCEGFRGLRVF